MEKSCHEKEGHPSIQVNIIECLYGKKVSSFLPEPTALARAWSDCLKQSLRIL